MLNPVEQKCFQSDLMTMTLKSTVQLCYQPDSTMATMNSMRKWRSNDYVVWKKNTTTLKYVEQYDNQMGNFFLWVVQKHQCINIEKMN